MLKTNEMFRKLAIGNSELHQLTPEELKQLHKMLLEMIVDLDALCRKHHIRYSLSGGSALGAVRHKGFIPWDDDIDIYMPRKDYERFRGIVLSECSDRYWVSHIEENPLYDLNFMKIRKKGTKYVEVFETDMEHAGVFIDIFPLENVPNNTILRCFHGWITDFLLLCASCVRIAGKKERLLAYAGNTKAAKSIRIKSVLGKLLGFMDVQGWCRVVEKWASICKNEKSDYVAAPSCVKHYFGELYRRETFFPTQDILFENETLMIMNDPDAFLTQQYGDYHKIPKPENREIHSVLEIKL